MAGLRERAGLWRMQRWISEHEVADPQPLPSVSLRAIVCTWHEADIIATTVRTALEQGCVAVHLLDNGSADDTVEEAVAAGATLEEVFTTTTYPQDERPRLIREVVDRVSLASGEQHVWWLHLDADELVEGPESRSILDLLAGLDRSYRVVGSDTINHYPRRDAPLPAGADPRGFASWTQPRSGPACRVGHWKHPLVRWDAAGPEVHVGPGFHTVEADRRLIEPPTAIVARHYPYRNRAVTEARLELLQPRIEGHRWAMGRRRANLDAIYREAFDEVDPFDMIGPGQRFDPQRRPPVR